MINVLKKRNNYLYLIFLPPQKMLMKMKKKLPKQTKVKNKIKFLLKKQDFEHLSNKIKNNI